MVGGGSTYTPELADGLARLRDDLPVEELILVDPDADRLAVVGGLTARIMAKRDAAGRVRTTSDLEDGVEGADAVLVQLRVGGQAAREQDETWPLLCGCVGQETTGAGGLAKALRTVPVVLDVAERVRRVNPTAWIVDFTNPVGIVTRALLLAGHRAVGLCNVAIGLQRHLAGLLDAPTDAVQLDHVGLNHLTWETGVRLRSGTGGYEQVLPRLLEDHAAELAAHLALPPDLLQRIGAIPSYYLRYFYCHDEVVRVLQHSASRASQVASMERTLLEMYANPALDEKPALLEQRGGAYYSEAAVALVAALLGKDGERRERQVVNVRNDATLPFLPPDAVVEVPATVTGTGAIPEPVGPVPSLFAGLIAHTYAYEELALDAALHGGRELVARALLAHPLVGQYDAAERLADLLVAHNREHLPWA